MLSWLFSSRPPAIRAAIVAAAVFSATTAQAAIDIPKTANGKPGWLDAGATGACHDVARGNEAPFAAPASAPYQTLSALDRIRLRQEGPSPEPAAERGNVTARATLAMAPASAPACRENAAMPRALSRSDPFQPAADPDSELGTVAIPVDTTRFDARWARVRRAAPASQMRAELGKAGVAAGLGERDLLERVNQSVNREITYVDDSRNYGQRDFWATAGETVARRRGDCEDFAILKMQMLRAAGIDGDRMKLVLLRDLAVGADHAVLLVRSRDGWLALDNMTDRLYGGQQAGDMRPMLSFSGTRRWIHGYADGASAPVESAIPVRAEADPARIEKPVTTRLAGQLAKTAATRDTASGFALASLTLAPTTVRDMLGRRRLFESR